MASNKGEVIDNTMIIPELLDMVKQLKPLYDKYEIDELVSQHNKTVQRLPPYHYVQNLLIEGVNKVTEEMWRNFVSYTENEEDKFWNIDMIVDELMAERQDLVMTIGQSDNDDDDSFSDLDKLRI
ncbi:hypothetical protein QTP88_010820 [Uroleucon formosanum]